MKLISLLKTFFRHAEEGYVLLLSLLAMPVFVGFGLLIIDVGRGNNAQADLQAAADAVALAGARELDGAQDALTRAQAAMAEVTNSVSMLEPSGDNVIVELTYSNAATEFQVRFLNDIPDSDDTPIDANWLRLEANGGEATTDPARANYVWVKAQSVNLRTTFLNPANLLQPNSVPLAAIAVATTGNAACDVTPLYICNPFEYDSAGAYQGSGFRDAFRSGFMHARLFRLHPKGSDTERPGNFGFLQTPGSPGGNALRDALAGGGLDACLDSSTVTTKTGATNSVRQGLNTRFDIFEGSFGNSWTDYAPATNVRKGYIPAVSGGQGQGQGNVTYDHCGASRAQNPGPYAEDTSTDPPTVTGDGVMGFPYNAINSPPTQVDAQTGAPAGAQIGRGIWDLTQYFQVNHGIAVPNELLTNAAFNSALEFYDLNTDPSGVQVVGSTATDTNAGRIPSRYDVYRYEILTSTGEAVGPLGTIASNLDLLNSWSAGPDNDTSSQNGETGAPICHASRGGNGNGQGQGNSPAALNFDANDPNTDRRLLVAAIIDCGSNEGTGQTTFNVNTYARIFLASPMEQNGNNAPDPLGEDNDASLDVEIVDISGAGGTGTLDTFIRTEVFLVR